MDDLAEIDAMPLDQLEDRMRLLAAQLAAAECDFLTLLGEFDRREGWGGWGMRSAAHWLSLHCGMQLGPARERVRVARALTQLPLLHEAFADGRLSYCKVRALTRVATPVTERELVEVAVAATGAQLERIVRQWRTTLVAEMSASSQLRRGLRRREELDGSVIYTLRVPPEDAATLDAALHAARRIVLDDTGLPVETPEETQLAAELTDEPPASRASADAFVLLAETFLAPDQGGHRRTTTEVIIHADLDALPAHTQPGEPLETDPTTGTSPPARAPDCAEGPDGRSLAQRAARVRPPTCTIEDGGQLAAGTVLRLLCEASVRVMVAATDGNPLDLGRSARNATHQQRRALKCRDDCCRFPGCTRTERLIPHHVRWWTHLGPTDMDNLVLICPAHHRAVHEVGYTVTALGGGRFVFHRPDGQALPDTAPAAEQGPRQLPDRRLDATTISPTWGGERLDLDLLIGGLSANILNAAGHHLVTIPDRDLAATLRAAARWPLSDKPRPRHAAAAA